jgi:hypothetical protein
VLIRLLKAANRQLLIFPPHRLQQSSAGAEAGVSHILNLILLEQVGRDDG